MRKVLGLSVVLLMCVALSSCGGNRPEKAFMGTWEGTHEGKTVELSFKKKDIFIVKYSGESKVGMWTIDPEGNAVMAIEYGKTLATPMSDGTLVARPEDGSDAIVFKRSDSKKK